MTTYGNRCAILTIAGAIDFAPFVGAHFAYVQHTVLYI